MLSISSTVAMPTPSTSANVASTLGFFRVVPGIALFVTFYGLFYALTPARYRAHHCRKWPGALLVTLWWMATVELLPVAIGFAGGYDLTYGSLAGVMIALLFFFVVSPVLFGGGRRLFENLREPGPQFRIDRVVNSPTATHLRYVRE